MPVNIVTGSIKYKDSNGEYQEITGLKGESSEILDVQVNGASVLENGVANVPYANGSTPGVITLGPGLWTTGGKTGVDYAGTLQIKGGLANAAMPVSRQHLSTFYGLAKAAGVDMAASDNVVGIYTEEAKVAIQKMLGIYEPPFELIRDITLSERTNLDITVDSNGEPLNLYSIFIEIFYTWDLISESEGYGRYLFYDQNNRHVYAETGRYVTNSNPSYKSIYVYKKSNMTIANFTRQSTTGNYAPWNVKHLDSYGTRFDLDNIVRIKLKDGDYEPAGTRIKIYAQRAY